MGVNLPSNAKKAKLADDYPNTLTWNNRIFADLNRGKEFPFNYDRRHSIKLMLIHQFSKNFKISSSWVYGSGYPFQLATQRYPITNELANRIYSRSGSPVKFKSYLD